MGGQQSCMEFRSCCADWKRGAGRVCLLSGFVGYVFVFENGMDGRCGCRLVVRLGLSKVFRGLGDLKFECGHRRTDLQPALLIFTPRNCSFLEAGMDRGRAFGTQETGWKCARTWLDAVDLRHLQASDMSFYGQQQRWRELYASLLESIMEFRLWCNVNTKQKLAA